MRRENERLQREGAYVAQLSRAPARHWAWFNRRWDRLARTKIDLGSRGLPAFQVCGYTGVLAAIALTMTLTARTGLSYWMMGAIVVSSMLSFLTLVAATKVISGEEQIIYYHHEIGVILVAALLVKALRCPVLPYLDATILGIGAFLACGRLGCLMVGCCHGRPCSWGIRYREEHAQEGFAPYLVGVTLFPIQALESLWVGCVVVVGAAMMWTGQPPGSALSWYTVAYGAARFTFEFIRGDTDRPYTWGFSQGQWLSLWLMGTILWAEVSSRIPFHGWHAATFAGLLVLMLAVIVHRRLDRSQRFRILHPHHVREVAAAVHGTADKATSTGDSGRWTSIVRVNCTSMGMHISHGQAGGPADAADHYTLSQAPQALTRPAALLMADLILGLKGESRPARLLPGEYGAFHLMMPSDHQKGAAL